MRNLENALHAPLRRVGCNTLCAKASRVQLGHGFAHANPVPTSHRYRTYVSFIARCLPLGRWTLGPMSS